MADAARRAGQNQDPPLFLRVMRHWLARHASRIETGLGPRRLRVGAPEHDSVMQPEGTVLPELDLERDQPIAAPISGRATGPSPNPLVRRSFSLKRRT